MGSHELVSGPFSAFNEQQNEVGEFEAELLADLEDEESQVVAYAEHASCCDTATSLCRESVQDTACDLEQSPAKRQKQEAPRTPDVNDTNWNRKTGLLDQLPPEVVLRLFGFLSAEDLAVSAQACQYLASVSSQDELWQRLYCARCAFGLSGA